MKRELVFTPIKVSLRACKNIILSISLCPSTAVGDLLFFNSPTLSETPTRENSFREEQIDGQHFPTVGFEDMKVRHRNPTGSGSAIVSGRESTPCPSWSIVDYLWREPAGGQDTSRPLLSFSNTISHQPGRVLMRKCLLESLSRPGWGNGGK